MELIEKYEEGIHDLESFFLVKKNSLSMFEDKLYYFFLAC